MTIQIGLNEISRNKIAKDLSILLSSTFILYVKTLNFHWNTTGVKFQPMHKIYEDQYKDLASAIDVIAERIRALGFKAPGSTLDFNELSVVKEAKGNLDEDKMIWLLNKDNAVISSLIREYLPEISSLGDDATADLLNKRLGVHDKVSWMLRSFLDDGKSEIRYDVTNAA